MPTRCPRCRRDIAEPDIHVRNDLARCRACGVNWSFAMLADGLPEQHPPPGAWLVDDGRELRIGARVRSAAAPVMLAIALFVSLILGTVTRQSVLTDGWWALRLAPFWALPLTCWWGVLHCLLGAYEVRVSGDTAVLIVSNGPFRLRRRFDPRAVRSVRRGDRGSDKGAACGIRINADTTISFGLMLPEERREFMLGALAVRLVTPARAW